jgi:hypothetical protein
MTAVSETVQTVVPMNTSGNNTSLSLCFIICIIIIVGRGNFSYLGNEQFFIFFHTSFVTSGSSMEEGSSIEVRRSEKGNACVYTTLSCVVNEK